MVEKFNKVSIQGVDFEVDLLRKEFRRIGVPSVKIDFESKWGMKLCQRFGIAQCCECGAYSKPKRIQDQSQCGNCGLLFVPAEVIA